MTAVAFAALSGEGTRPSVAFAALSGGGTPPPRPAGKAGVPRLRAVAALLGVLLVPWGGRAQAPAPYAREPAG